MTFTHHVPIKMGLFSEPVAGDGERIVAGKYLYSAGLQDGVPLGVLRFTLRAERKEPVDFEVMLVFIAEGGLWKVEEALCESVGMISAGFDPELDELVTDIELSDILRQWAVEVAFKAQL
ncbi:MAG: hypothetical protein ACKV0T_13280 [Planctomycetales bacterium]